MPGVSEGAYVFLFNMYFFPFSDEKVRRGELASNVKETRRGENIWDNQDCPAFLSQLQCCSGSTVEMV